MLYTRPDRPGLIPARHSILVSGEVNLLPRAGDPPSSGRQDTQRPNSKKNIVNGTYAGVVYNLTLCPLSTPESTPTHVHGNGQPYARVDLNPIPESTLSPSQGLRIWPQEMNNFTRCNTVMYLKKSALPVRSHTNKRNVYINKLKL
jgi:hypothetical protein